MFLGCQSDSTESVSNSSAYSGICVGLSTDGPIPIMGSKYRELKQDFTHGNPFCATCSGALSASTYFITS
jgi:hypothetical protein